MAFDIIMTFDKNYRSYRDHPLRGDLKMLLRLGIYKACTIYVFYRVSLTINTSIYPLNTKQFLCFLFYLINKININNLFWVTFICIQKSLQNNPPTNNPSSFSTWRSWRASSRIHFYTSEKKKYLGDMKKSQI